MTQITVKLTVKEFELLSSLAADQLFRREFIEPRLPNFKCNPEDVCLGKKLVERLRVMTDRANKMPPSRKSSARLPGVAVHGVGVPGAGVKDAL